MKKIFIAAFIVTALFSSVSCTQDFDEINTDPNRPINVLSYGLFNNANKQVMDYTRSGFNSGRMTLPWVQYSAQKNYTPEDLFQYRPETNTSVYTYLSRAAQNYKTIIDLNIDPKTRAEMSKYGNNDNQIAAARTMLSYVYLQLVDMYGDIPYYSYGSQDPDFQALHLEENILKPKFAPQSKIYTDLLKELKEASEMIVLGEAVFTKGDQLFGSAEKLKKFSNSLRLRIANRVKGVIPGAENHITEAIVSGVMTSNDDTVTLKYENNRVNPSPFYTAYFIQNRNDFGVANTFVDLLKGELGVFGLDPRLQKYVAPNDATLSQIRDQTYQETNDLTKYKGMPYGIVDAVTASQKASSSVFSYNVLKPDYAEVFMEYAEVEFLLSENNGWDDASYKKGVQASMERWGVDAGKIATFVAALPAASQANVLNQKYIALYMQPYEAWSEYRRTGFPNTILLPGQTYKLNVPYTNAGQTTTTYVFIPIPDLKEMPSRFQYPVNLQTLNGENYKEASQNIGGDKLDTKLIWDKN